MNTKAPTAVGDHHPTAGHRPGRVRELIAVNVGNTLEWYDWTIYTIFAHHFAVKFFSADDPASALLSAFAVFAVGFVTRPLGGIVFGRYADRVGRRSALAVAMSLTALGSLIIAVTPDFDQIGVFASVILVVARLLQGLAHGGEMGTSVTYLVERAPRAKRALWGSTTWVSVVLGTMLATATGLGLNAAFGAEATASWGWRVAFGIGGVLGLYALYIRRKLPETEAFTASITVPGEVDEADPAPTTTSERTAGAAPAARQAADRPKQSIWRHWRAILAVFGISAGGSIMFYTWLIYMPTFAQVQHGQSESSALAASLIAQAIFLVLVLGSGWLGDRVGRKPLVIVFGVVAVATTVPLFALVDGTFARLLIAMVLALAGLALLFGVNGAVWAELFPTEFRATGVAAPLSLATALFGGTAPYVNQALSGAGNGALFPWYLSAIAAITLVTGLLMRETKHTTLE